MRKLVVVAVAMAVVSMATAAQAEFKKYKNFRGYRGSAPKGDATAPAGCAISFNIEELVGNLTNGSEDVMVGTTSLGKISTIANVKQGDTVLFASSSFATAAAITADGTIAENVCAQLAAGATVTIKGSFTNLDSFALPAGFGEGKAVSKDNATAAATLVDPATTPIVFTNKAGTTSKVGTTASSGADMAGADLAGADMAGAAADMATAPGSSSSGCSMAGVGAATGAPLFAVVGLLLAARRRRDPSRRCR